jgi:hypothetical protein
MAAIRLDTLPDHLQIEPTRQSDEPAAPDISPLLA